MKPHHDVRVILHSTLGSIAIVLTDAQKEQLRGHYLLAAQLEIDSVRIFALQLTSELPE